MTQLAQTSRDNPELIRLLENARLPTSDLGQDQQLFYLFNDASGAAVGCGGFLLAGDDALIRSIAVPDHARGRGVGGQIVSALLSEARKAGARHAWLLTSSAEAFFAKGGFERVDRAVAPDAIRATPQFSGICPGSAAFMHKALQLDV